MEQSKALSKPDFRHILADINWEHGSHLVLAAKRSDSQGLLLKSVPFTYAAFSLPNWRLVINAGSRTRQRSGSGVVSRCHQDDSIGTSYGGGPEFY